MKGIQRIVLWGVLTLSVLVGCNRQSTELAQVKTPSEKPQNRFAQKMEVAPAIQTLSSRLHITLSDGGKELSVKGHLKMVRDEHIQVSIQPFLGIEMLRADITPDSICVIDRLKKRYVVVDLGAYEGQLPIHLGLHAMQSLFLNELFLIHKQMFTDSDARKLKWQQGQDDLYRGTYRYRDQTEMSFWLNPQNELVKTGIVAKSHHLDWEYRDFESVATTTFPMSQQVIYRSQNRTLSAVFNFHRTELNSPMRLSFDMPRSYTEISFTDLLNTLTSL